MNHPNSMPGREGSSPPTEGIAEQSFFFICSRNFSIIAGYKIDLEIQLMINNGACGHYFASADALRAREREARKASLPFVGKSYMGSKCEPMSHIHEVLVELEIMVAHRSGIYVAFISVDQSGVSDVHESYGRMLRFWSDSFLPYPMYVTNDEGSAESLLDSFESRPW
jgi:hypothetical protein